MNVFFANTGLSLAMVQPAGDVAQPDNKLLPGTDDAAVFELGLADVVPPSEEQSESDQPTLDPGVMTPLVPAMPLPAPETQATAIAAAKPSIQLATDYVEAQAARLATTLAVSPAMLPAQPLPMAQLAALSRHDQPQVPLNAFQLSDAWAQTTTQAMASATSLRSNLPSRQAAETVEPASPAPSVRTSGPEPSWANAATTLSAPLERNEGVNSKATPALDATTQHKLFGALGERIHVQARQGVQNAVIDLAPYMAGKVRIELHHEAGALQVRISASHAEVTQQLQAISESLRQELNSRQFNDVAVHINPGRHADHGGRGGQSGQDGDTPHQQVPGRALAADASDEAFGEAWARANASRGYPA